MRYVVLVIAGFWLASSLYGCTPLVVTGAAAGGAYVGYTLRDEGYKINITKEVKGSKPQEDNSTSQ